MTALDTIEDHRSILNDIAALAQSDILDFIENALVLPTAMQTEALTNGVPLVIAPYMGVATTVSAQFYNIMREEAAVSTKLAYTAFDAISLLTPNTMTKLYILAGVGVGLVGVAGYLAVREHYAQMAQKAVYSASRENVRLNGKKDTDFKREKRVSRPGACAWCLMMSVIAEKEGSFHDYCRCVEGGLFSGEDDEKYKSDFSEKFLRDYKSAAKKAEGFDDTRKLKSGTKEFEASLRKELAGPAREWRKGFEERRNLSPDQAAKQRTSTNSNISGIAAKLSNGEILNSKELSVLDSWGVDLADISTKQYRNASASEKALSVLRSEYGYR